MGRLVAWLTAAMALITVVIVVLRYGFDTGAIALQESVIYLHAVASHAVKVADPAKFMTEIDFREVDRFGNEAELIRIAGEFETAMPWADRIPPVHVSL